MAIVHGGGLQLKMVNSPTAAFIRAVAYNYNNVNRLGSVKEVGLSIRCLKD